ncbi:MAG: rRNA maturation RNase YbeY [Longimicrobiales bacterium]
MPLRVRVNREVDPRDVPGAAALPPWRRLAPQLRAAALATLRDQGASEAELGLTLLDDDAMRALNRRWLQRDEPTDVIAFPLHQRGAAVLGDIYIGMATALRNASESGVVPAEELIRLAVHGTLHVLGHEHPEGPGRTRSAMWRLQERLVHQLMAERRP